MAKKTEQNTNSAPDASAVAQRAYEIWMREGCPDGRALEHWLRAEGELGVKGSGSAGNLKPRARRSGSKGAERQLQIAGQ